MGIKNIPIGIDASTGQLGWSRWSASRVNAFMFSTSDMRLDGQQIGYDIQQAIEDVCVDFFLQGFAGQLPARASGGVAALPRGADIEVDCIANAGAR